MAETTVTNPGLVNVADQVAGNPSTKVDALSVPKDTDQLVTAADEGYPPGRDVSLAADGGTTVGPTPTEVLVGDLFLAVPSPTAQIPGTAPLYAPTPQDSISDSLSDQFIPQAGTTEITVGPGLSNIQTNQNADTERGYTVTSVRDADTGGAVVEPPVPVVGPFAFVFDAGGGKLVIVSPTAFPPVIVDGVIVTIIAPSKQSYTGTQAVSGVTSLAGTVASVNDAGSGKIAVSSPVPLAGLADGQVVLIATSVPSYNIAAAVSDVTNLNGAFSLIADAGGGKITVVSPSILPAGLVAGKSVTLSGAYTDSHSVSNVVNLAGSFTSVTDAGGGVVTVHSPTALPAGLLAGQQVTISGSTNYDGTYAIANVTANTFDVTPLGGFVADDAGNWAAYTFDLNVAYASSYAGTWTCYTFNVTAPWSVTATGTFSSYTFQVLGTYAGSASGTWTYQPASYFTTRYRLGVSPADLRSFGISLVGRELVFDDDTLTVADQGASRLVTAFGGDSVVVSKQDLSDGDVPVMITPQAGDTFTIFVQREGSEVFTEDTGQSVDVTISPPPPAFVPNAPQAEQVVDVVVAPLPGNPIVSSGVGVPTARTVNVADQSTSVGLPVNVYV